MKKAALFIFVLLIVSFIVSSLYNHEDVQQEIISTPIGNSQTKSDHPIYDQLAKELDSTEIYNDSVIYGYWFQPHAAAEINLFLHKDGGFELKYCDDTIKGRFIIDGRVVRMTPHDGWSGVTIDGRLFHKHNETNFYLTDCKERELYLVKGGD